jgi:hypothetical protein
VHFNWGQLTDSVHLWAWLSSLLYLSVRECVLIVVVNLADWSKSHPVMVRFRQQRDIRYRTSLVATAPVSNQSTTNLRSLRHIMGNRSLRRRLCSSLLAAAAVATMMACSSGTASAVTIAGCKIVGNPQEPWGSLPDQHTKCPGWKADGVTIAYDPGAVYDFEDDDLDSIDLNEGVNLAYAELQGARFNDAHMNGIRLSFAHMENSSFINAGLYRVEADQAIFDNSDMRSVNLAEAVLTGASLVDANLVPLSINNVSWNKADLTGTPLVQAKDITKVVSRETKVYILDQLLKDPKRPSMVLQRCETDNNRPAPIVMVDFQKSFSIKCWTEPSGKDQGRAYGKSQLKFVEQS